MTLNYDILFHILFLNGPNPKFFRLSKKIYELKSQYLLLHMKNINQPVPYHKDVTNHCLLFYYSIKIKKDIGSYRKYILHFLANKNRKVTIYPCVNSYHRMLVHKFCDSQGLKHETIIKGNKKLRTCKNCKSANIDINSHEYGEYYCYCNNCMNHYSGYTALDNFVCYTSLPQKVIRITKI
jgi:hypothetical protein